MRTKQLGARRRREERSVMCDSRLSGKSDLPEKFHDDWCEEVVEDGYGSRERVERTSGGHRALKKG